MRHVGDDLVIMAIAYAKLRGIDFPSALGSVFLTYINVDRRIKRREGQR